jgi:hypothetical protein
MSLACPTCKTICAPRASACTGQRTSATSSSAARSCVPRCGATLRPQRAGLTRRRQSTRTWCKLRWRSGAQHDLLCNSFHFWYMNMKITVVAMLLAFAANVKHFFWVVCLFLYISLMVACNTRNSLRRGLRLGTFLEHQMALHARSSIAETTFTAMMPIETSRQVTLSHLTEYELKWRIGHIPFTGPPPCDTVHLCLGLLPAMSING